MENSINILIVLNVNTQDEAKILKKINEFRNYRNVKMSLLYVIPDMHPLYYHSTPMLGNSKMIGEHIDAECLQGKEILLQLGKCLNIPEADRYLGLGSMHTETKSLATQLDIDVVIGYKPTLFELINKFKLLHGFKELFHRMVLYTCHHHFNSKSKPILIPIK